MRILFKILEEDLFNLILNVPVNIFSVMLKEENIKRIQKFRNKFYATEIWGVSY